MKNFRNEFMTTSAILTIVAALANYGTAAPHPISIVPTEEGFVISEGEEKVMVYQRKHKSLAGKYTRANYIHPLYGLDSLLDERDGHAVFLREVPQLPGFRISLNDEILEDSLVERRQSP